MADSAYDKFSRRVNAGMKSGKPSTRIKILLNAKDIYPKA